MFFDINEFEKWAKDNGGRYHGHIVRVVKKYIEETSEPYAAEGEIKDGQQLKFTFSVNKETGHYELRWDD